MKSFKTWLRSFIGHPSIVGDLACDVCNDKNFPSKACSYQTIYDYLEPKDDDVIIAFLDAWSRYQMYLREVAE